MAGHEKIFKGSQNAGKRYSKIDFANTVNASFNKTSFQLSSKHYIAVNSSKLPNFDDIMAQFYLNFPKFQKFGGATPPLPRYLRPWRRVKCIPLMSWHDNVTS